MKYTHPFAIYSRSAPMGTDAYRQNVECRDTTPFDTCWLHNSRRGVAKGSLAMVTFSYDSTADTFTCPAGETLTRRKHKKARKAYEYACPASVCRACSLRPQCTKAKGAARSVKRHYNQEAVDIGRAQSYSKAARRDRVRRKWLMEGSFADAANNHGFKRSRWRRLW